MSGEPVHIDARAIVRLGGESASARLRRTEAELGSAMRRLTVMAGERDGLVATLHEAMQRLHNAHSGPEFSPWRDCQTSTLCREASAQLFRMSIPTEGAPVQ